MLYKCCSLLIHAFFGVVNKIVQNNIYIFKYKLGIFSFFILKLYVMFQVKTTGICTLSNDELKEN